MQKIYVSQEEKTIKRRVIAMEVESDFVQMYKNLFLYMMKVRSPWSFKYMMFLISRMNNKNQVDVGVVSTREFQEAIKEGGIEPPVERTMKMVVTELVDLNLLVRINRGEYKINPAIFWQAGMKERIEHVTALVEGGHDLKPGIVVLEENEEEINKRETRELNGSNAQDIGGQKAIKESRQEPKK